MLTLKNTVCGFAMGSALLVAAAPVHASQPVADGTDEAGIVYPGEVNYSSSASAVQGQPVAQKNDVVRLAYPSDMADHTAVAFSISVADDAVSEACFGEAGFSECCNDSGCGDACCGCGDACGDSCGLFSDGCLGDPWLLSDRMCSPITVGGWFSTGYHSDNTRQSLAFNDLLSYNDVPGQLNLHQGWMFLEKQADASRTGVDFGFRADMIYGTDAQSLQSNGSARAAENRNQGNWDGSLDHGEYGWAFPQLYGEIAVNDWKVKAGYFLSLIGYESSLAPDNFFYSHSLTMFNSEPFTHTGVLAENTSIDGLTLYGGWVMGWDAAWEQQLGGSAFLGGFSADLNSSSSFTYMFNVGDFGYRGNNGYNHSIVLESELTDNLEYAFQSDYFIADDAFAVAGDTIEEFGVNQYLYYFLSDGVAVGGRLEWWNSNGPTGTSQSYYEITGGVNIRPNANLTIRPEVRYDWTPAEDSFANATGVQYNNTVFGIDAVLTY